MKKFHIYLTVLLIVFLSGCSTFNPEQTKKDIESDVNQYYDNLLIENLDAVMNQIATDSNQYYDLYNQYRETFQNYHYSYNVKEISFNRVTKDEVIVKTYVTVSGVDQNDKFNSYDMVQTFTFKPLKNNDWKINSLDTSF